MPSVREIVERLQALQASGVGSLRGPLTGRAFPLDDLIDSVTTLGPGAFVRELGDVLVAAEKTAGLK